MDDYQVEIGPIAKSKFNYRNAMDISPKYRDICQFRYELKIIYYTYISRIAWFMLQLIEQAKLFYLIPLIFKP